jgi:hypothetical protein
VTDRAACWTSRVIFALFVGLAPALAVLGSANGDAGTYHLEVTMTSSAPGMLQVFFDRGNGIVVPDSAAVAILQTTTPTAYRVPLPLGTYRLFRIDPNSRPGTYGIERFAILRPGGEVLTALPLDRLVAAHQATIEVRQEGVATVVTPPDGGDPQLLLEPESPIALTPSGPVAAQAVRAFAAAAIAALLLMLLLEFATGRMNSIRLWLIARPTITVVLAALLGSAAATYPLILGRSLVSPNTGGMVVLYDQAPFVYGSRDLTIEDVRGTDVGAMMWAILPYTAIQRQALEQGEWPLWNRYNKAGEPLWGQGQTFFLDPVHAMSLLIPDVALAMDLRFVAARVIFALGIGMVVLSLTGSTGAAALMAVAAPFVGYYTMRLNHPAYFSLTYAPWVLLAYAAMSRATSRRALAVAAAGLAFASWLQLVGSTPKEGAVALAAVHVAGLIGMMLHRRTWQERLAALDMAAIAGVLFVLASAPHWLIFLDTLSRAYTNYDRPQALFAGWPDFVGTVLGAAGPGFPRPGIHALAAGLALAALLQVRSLRQNRFAAGALAGATAFGAIALGALPESFLTRIPLVGNIHHVGFSFTAAVVPIVLVIAGVGAAALMDRDASGRRILAVLVGVFAFALWLSAAVPGATFSAGRLISLYSIAGAAAVIGLIAMARRYSSPALGVALVPSLAAAVVAGGLSWETGILAADEVLIQPRPRVELTRFSPALEAIASQHGEPFRVAPFGTVMFPGTQAFWEFEGVGGPDAVRLPLLEELSDVSTVERTSWVWLTLLNQGNLATARGYLDLLNVRYLVARDNSLPPHARPLPLEGADLVRVVERPTAWPRAFFVDGVERHETVLDFAARLAKADRPFASISPDEASAAPGVSELPHQATTVVPARDYGLTVNRTIFTVETSGPGLAVVSEAFVERDFRATLNGQPVPYLRVNHAFKGVAIPGAGVWRVEFEYRPALWSVSWALAAAGWAGIAGLVVMGRRRTVC